MDGRTELAGVSNRHQQLDRPDCLVVLQHSALLTLGVGKDSGGPSPSSWFGLSNTVASGHNQSASYFRAPTPHYAPVEN